jgi:uncharacterized membrane protein
MTTIDLPAPPASIPRAAPIAGARITEIDMLRGLVICLMALDHVRDYFTNTGFHVNLMDPAQTTPALYFTRWVTHLCAPTFVFLAGVSAYLQFTRGKSTAKLARFLLTRGLWLIVLDATVISFGWAFAAPWLIFLQVIWAIGWAMVALSALVWLPRMAVLTIGIGIICLHNLLDPITPAQFGSFGWVWTVLHEGGVLQTGGVPWGLIAYPILPWIGIITFGYGVGALFMEPAAKRDRIILTMGLSMLAAFFVLRFFNFYGDFAGSAVGPGGVVPAWRDQTTLGAQIMVFFDVQKYPPSLQFTLVTLGFIFTIWPLLSRLRGPVASFFNTFGAVPFFFYVLHIYLIHLLAMAANAAAGRNVSGLFDYMTKGFLGSPEVDGLGFPLFGVYIAWFAVLAIMYPLCRYWQALKARRNDWWLSYL